MEIYHESVQLAFMPKLTTIPIDQYRGGVFFPMKVVMRASEADSRP
jgi:hypothetical protein